MNRITLSFLLLLSVLTMSAGKVARYSGSRIFWDSRTPVTVFHGGGYARMIELQDGRLMACCESGGIKIAYSNDKGKSWGTPQLIVTNRNNTPNCVPDLIQLKDGTLIVAYNPRPSQPYTPDRHFGIRLKRSTDNGKTWSEEVFVFDADITFENGCWEPSLLELPTGELQLYFADESPYTTNGDQQISVCRSWDGGQTWSAPAKVSYRQGFRDGMPVPVLLKDGSTIAVAIEDNGLGYGDFVPATVRNTVNMNWRAPVTAASSYRKMAVDTKYSPVATGGAPYLRVLPGGETVLSHQSKYNHGDKHNMYVYVGSDKALGFKAMSSPFHLSEGQEAMWNSLAVIDTGVVVAVAGFGGNINIVKGYPKRQLEVAFGTPKVNGIKSTADGYYTRQGNQIMMGNETGTWSYGDLAYNADSLYFACQVYDSKMASSGEDADFVSISIDTKAASYDAPQESSYRFDIHPDATCLVFVGNGREWTSCQAAGVHVACRKSTLGYTLEMAVAWSDMGVDGKQVYELADQQTMTFNLAITNAKAVERIPDAKADEPSTWMPLHFIEDPEATGLGARASASLGKAAGIYDLGGRRVANPGKGVYVENHRLRVKN